jgi:diguanylate cyclase (GGDEF)-like protein/PAS domain S-box-containing protein
MEPSMTATRSAPHRGVTAAESLPAHRHDGHVAWSRRLERMPVGIFEVAPDGTYRFVNARLSEYQGLSPGIALDRGWTEGIHPDDRDRVAEAWRDLLADGREFRLEYRYERPDGTTIWVSGGAAAMLDPQGEISGHVGTVTDVTEAVGARHQLLAERRYVDTILDTVGSLVCVLDPEGRILRFNRACELLTGFTFEEVRGRPFYDFLLPESEIESVKLALAAVRPNEPPAASENNWLTRSGESRLIAWLDTCFFDDAGALTHIVSTGLDITDERRGDAALDDIEAIGALLATSGPTRATLTTLLARLGDRMGYACLALLICDGPRLNLGAQVGYGPLPETFETNAGISRRVLRTGEAELVRDVHGDPDYIEGHEAVTSEIAVPLLAEGVQLGVLSIGSTIDAPLSDADLRLARRIGERLSVALLVGREQLLLADRARLFAALTGFARTANSILDEELLVPALLDALGEIVPADAIGLAVLDRATGRYVLRGLSGTAIDQAAVGADITPGEGVSGRAIANRALVMTRLDRRTYPKATRRHVATDSMISVAVPLIHDGIVLGAISAARTSNVEPGFSDLEREVLTLIGTQAALALANTHLLAEVRAMAIRDALTGLYNRRHFDAALEHILARWVRDRDGRRPVAAVMFDLDHFGQVNKDHGHQAGDEVLRTFGGILVTRFRSADLVARYGGEEFVAIMEGATRDDAVAAAEDVRRELESRVIVGPGGVELRATVSAGCAELDPVAPSREALIRTADVGLFMAKRGGRNQVVAT